MRIRATRSALFAGAVAVLALAGAPALAQDAVPAQAVTEEVTPDAAAIDDATLGQALMLDPASLAGIAPARTLALPRLKRQKTFDVSRSTTQPDGSGTVVVKQSLPIAWDAKIGADIGVAGDTRSTYSPQLPPPSSSNDGNGGAAWASIGLSNMASVDARLDPTNEQGRIAGTLKHSMPVGGHLSMTLQNSYSVTDTFNAPAQVFDSERTVKLNVLPTGTTLAAGVTSSSVDPVTRNRLSAEQQLLGPLSVTTAVTDVGQPTANKSIHAGFKLHW